MKTAIVFGATGQTGEQLTNLLLEDERYSIVKIFVRHPTGKKHAKLQQIVNPLTNPDSIRTQITGDDFFCCLGTTIDKAGSKENFRRIDYYLPVSFAKIAAQNKVKNMVVMSALGADAQSKNFYLRTKGEMENAVAIVHGAENIVLVRPALLLGKREEFRFGERLAKALMPLINIFLMGRLRKYRGIPSATVAKAMIYYANDGEKGVRYIENDILLQNGK